LISLRRQSRFRSPVNSFSNPITVLISIAIVLQSFSSVQVLRSVQTAGFRFGFNFAIIAKRCHVVYLLSEVPAEARANSHEYTAIRYKENRQSNDACCCHPVDLASAVRLTLAVLGDVAKLVGINTQRYVCNAAPRVALEALRAVVSSDSSIIATSPCVAEADAWLCPVVWARCRILTFEQAIIFVG